MDTITTITLTMMIVTAILATAFTALYLSLARDRETHTWIDIRKMRRLATLMLALFILALLAYAAAAYLAAR